MLILTISSLLLGCSKEISYTAYNDLVTNLKDKGFNVTEKDVEKNILQGQRKWLTINEDENENISVYLYENNETMEKDAACIDEDGSGYNNKKNSTEIEWASFPHFFKKDNIIVLYVGENPEIIKALKEILGVQFAGYTDNQEQETTPEIECTNYSEYEFYYKKPVIYLYPEKKTKVKVNIQLDGQFTCTYPKYNNGWVVTAYPDGTLYDKNNKSYNYLYWEGITNTEYDFSKGFCVKGSDTAEFLEETLDKLGLNRKEANEFIIYWLPQMQNNKYNLITFQNDAYTNSAKLNITPKPESVIRVFMTYKSLNEKIDIEPQELITPKRNGFTVVEWGGAEVKK